MNQKNYELLELLQNVDEQMVYQAGQPWEEKKKKFFIPTSVCAAVVILVILAGMVGGFREHVVAAIRKFTTRISEILVNEKDLEPYMEVINQTKTIGSVSMTLNEVILDSNRIIVTVEAFSDKPVVVDERGVSNQMVSFGIVKINGEYLDSLVISQYATENPNQYVLEYSVEDGAIPTEISEVELMINYGIKNEEGLWENTVSFTYSFAAKNEELVKTTKTLPINADITAGDGLVFHLGELTYSDAAGRLKIICNKEPGRWIEEEDYRYYELPYYYSLDLEDDQGNSMSFDVLDISYNEEKRELSCDSFQGTPPAENAEYLDITLMRLKPSMLEEQEGREDDETYDFYQKEEKVGEIRVKLSH